MNFEQLSEKKYLNFRKKKKIKKFFEFHIDEIKFYDLVIFQTINVKIINVPFQDTTIISNSLIQEKSLNYYDFFLILFLFILTYFFIIEFLTIWYKENILYTDFKSFDKNILNNLICSNLSPIFCFSKKLSNLNNLLNSNIVDFLSIYEYVY